MAFLNSMSVVGSGLTAQQQRIDVIAENMTNINTTRTEDGGGTYRRKIVVLEAQENSFGSAMERASSSRNADTQMDGGVMVTQILEDQSDFRITYDPTHPDANEEGYVELPNIDLIKETADAMAASQAYNASVTAFNVLKEVTASGLQIGK